ncbi:hypothetical protein PTKIN_Ptkin11bG0127400 [Pterospermum kingtungense]
MKFNVDGSVKGYPGDARIRGVLRDHNANIKIVFSKYVGIVYSNLAKVLVVHKAFKLF